MRLQKFLSAAGVCSRRKGEEYIKAGRVAVNSQIVVELGTKVDPDMDLVQVDGNPVHSSQPLIYIALNKPRDYVTSCSHPGQKIVLDLVDISRRVYPIGRLDKDSTGLLLLTNDGRLHHHLSHPSFDHEKEYDVSVTKPITDGALQKLAQGLPLMETQTRPARVQRISARRFRMVLQEGKNRQVRRMVRKVGNQVTGLKRIRVANIKLGRLAPGAWRHLNDKEKWELLKIL
ncbi:LSU rRNA pseudouridine(2605) synthase (EC [Olavius sp. associated proteobacterium Delta 1]|nr:LSU rRNA pseudouridine(2605) synthase (EC [Olavius sp. associated proteobacterium Delta 1]